MASNISPTIRELARLIGVSRTTVSMALRNDTRVKKETRERIKKIAEKEGYHADALTSKLMDQLRTARRGRSLEKLAYLTNYETESHWRSLINDYTYFEGAQHRARQLGYSIDPIWSDQAGMNAKRMSQILKTRAIRGVLLQPAQSHSYMRLLPDGFAIVAISNSIITPGLNRVSHNTYTGMLMAMDRLLEQPFRRIAYINTSDHDDRVNNEWHSAFLFRKASDGKKRLLQPYIARKWNSSAFLAWYEKYRPDAIVSNLVNCITDLRRAKVRVPEDTAFYSLDLEANRLQFPFLGGVDQCASKIGEASAELLIGMLRNNNYGFQGLPMHLKLHGQWREPKQA